MKGGNAGVNRASEDKGPSRNEIRAQLEKMLADRVFSGADRLSRMLRHLVEAALDGSADDLKEYSVGIDVFDRDSSFDPRNDSVVRVHGSRLRSKLAEYYGSTGVDDRVIIELPKGGYVPVFRYSPEDSPERRLIPIDPRPSPAVAPNLFTWTRGRIALVAGVCVLLAAALLGVFRFGTVTPRVQTPALIRPITSMD